MFCRMATYMVRGASWRSGRGDMGQAAEASIEEGSSFPDILEPKQQYAETDIRQVLSTLFK